jgi:hypothetical protein
MQNAPLQAGRFFSVSTNSPTLRRNVQQFGGGGDFHFAVFIQLQICSCIPPLIYSVSFCHIRQFCGNDGALAFASPRSIFATSSGAARSTALTRATVARPTFNKSAACSSEIKVSIDTLVSSDFLSPPHFIFASLAAMTARWLSFRWRPPKPLCREPALSLQ